MASTSIESLFASWSDGICIQGSGYEPQSASNTRLKKGLNITRTRWLLTEGHPTGLAYRRSTHLLTQVAGVEKGIISLDLGFFFYFFWICLVTYPPSCLCLCPPDESLTTRPRCHPVSALGIPSVISVLCLVLLVSLHRIARSHLSLPAFPCV